MKETTDKRFRHQITSSWNHYSNAPIAGQSWTHPYEAGREPALTVHDAAPPPLLVGGIYHFDDVANFEAKLLDVHSNMVPEGFSIHHTAITDQLRKDTKQGYIFLLD